MRRPLPRCTCIQPSFAAPSAEPDRTTADTSCLPPARSPSALLLLPAPPLPPPPPPPPLRLEHLRAMWPYSPHSKHCTSAMVRGCALPPERALAPEPRLPPRSCRPCRCAPAAAAAAMLCCG